MGEKRGGGEKERWQGRERSIEETRRHDLNGVKDRPSRAIGKGLCLVMLLLGRNKTTAEFAAIFSGSVRLYL